MGIHKQSIIATPWENSTQIYSPIYNSSYLLIQIFKKGMAETFSVEAFIFVIILMIYVLASHVIEHRKVPFIHQSTIAIFMGILTAAIAKYVLKREIEFSNELFFTIILPPIIFSAGYSLRKSLFFQNFGMITFLGIIGTVIGFLCMTGFLVVINTFIFQKLTIQELLMISSVLCATDTIAAIALIKPDKFPVLNAVLFGEGIINDAVAIILFGTVKTLELDEAGSEFTFKIVLTMFLDFCYLFFFSLAFGTLTGFGLSYLFKIFQSFNKFPIQQASLILLNGYFTYLTGELLGLSGIITLFTCAIIMGHYSFMNISEQSQRGTGLAFETVSYITEAFVFTYLGASILSINGSLMAILMATMILCVMPFIRAIMVYIMPLVYKILKKEFPMNSKELKICWYSGMVRGVIAFALCLQIDTENTQFILTVALVIVMVTTLVGSTFLSSFAKCIGISNQDNDLVEQQMQQKMKDANLMSERRLPSSKYKTIGHDKQKDRHEIDLDIDAEPDKNKAFEKFENKYIKPIFQKKPSKKNVDLSYNISDYDKEIKQIHK